LKIEKFPSVVVCHQFMGRIFWVKIKMTTIGFDKFFVYKIYEDICYRRTLDR